jgi:branched-chain amino acid transport system permease protein
VTPVIQQIVTGLMTGSLYALVGVGVVVIVRATEIINFSQAAMGTFATFIALMLMAHLPYPVAFMAAVAVAVGLGGAVEQLVIRFLPEGALGGLSPLIVTLSLLLIFYGLTVSLWGGEPFPFPQPFSGPPLNLAGVRIGRAALYMFCVSLALIVVVHVLFAYTRLGLALRATAANRVAAELAGVPTRRMMTLAWGLGTACGAIAGMLLAQLASLSPTLMDVAMVFAFAAAVVGGLDSLWGTLVGGLLLGVIQSLTGAYIGVVVQALGLPLTIHQPQQYRDLVALLVLVVLLTLRPQGLFGRARVVKV